MKTTTIESKNAMPRDLDGPRGPRRQPRSRTFCWLVAPLFAATPPALLLAAAALAAATLPPRRPASSALPPASPVAAPDATQARAAQRQRVAAGYGRLPLTFEPNVGQAVPRARFISRGAGYTLAVNATEAVLSLQSAKSTAHSAKGSGTAAGLNTGHQTPNTATSAFGAANRRRPNAVLRMQLVGANPAAAIAGAEEQQGKVNYFVGNDPKKWRTNVPTYSRLQAREVYPGVDLAYYGNQRQLEHDFILRPGADPSRIRLRYAGAQSVSVNTSGDLVLKVRGGEVRQRRPLIYQEVNGVRRPVEGGYVLVEAWRRVPIASALGTPRTEGFGRRAHPYPHTPPRPYRWPSASAPTTGAGRW